MESPVLIDRHDATLVITLNRPSVRNAVDLETARLVADAMDQLDGTDSLAVGILTGAGGTFCSGMDLKGFGRGETPVVDGRGFGGLVERPPQKPLIAAVEGHAVAGGFELVLACDLVVAGRSARFGLPEVKRSIVAGGGGLLRLPQRVPASLATEMALTGDAVPAQRLFDVGMVSRLVDDGAVLDAALDIAARIAANGPLAVRATKRVLSESADWPVAEFFARQAPIIDPVHDSHDAREGALAFVEKRPPVWTRR